MVRVNGRAERVHNAINMREIISKIKSKDLEFSHGLLEMYIKENTKKMREMDLVKCVGQMGVYIVEFGKEVYSMDKEECFFLMALLRRAYLRITFTEERILMEALSNLTE